MMWHGVLGTYQRVKVHLYLDMAGTVEAQLKIVSLLLLPFSSNNN